MPKYRYKALSEKNGVEQGEIIAKTKNEAYERLAAGKLRPISLEMEQGSETSREVSSVSQANLPRLSATEVQSFSEELAELLESGLQLDPSLKVLESRGGNKKVAQVSGFLRHQVRDGVSFSAALRQCSKSFSELFCSMVSAGEIAGALGQVLRRHAQSLGILIEFRRRLVGAMIYPSIVFIAGIALILIFMVVLLPQLTSLLSRTGQKLPILTQILIGMSDLVAGYWWAGLILALAAAGGFFAWTSSPKGRLSWHRIQFKIPLFGSVLRDKQLAEFSQTLSVLVINGITLLQGIDLFKRASGNLYVRAELDRVYLKVAEGRTLTSSLTGSDLFTSDFIDILAVGENTGAVSASLQRAAKRYDQAFGNRISQLTALIQPLTILCVALFVGIVAYSMITGILSSISGLRAH